MKDCKNLRELLEDTMSRNSERRAFCLKKRIDGKIQYQDVTYRDFYNDIVGLATVLLSKGYTDNRVALIGKNSYEWIVTYFAVLCSGNVLVPLDSGLTLHELENNLSVAKVDCVFYEKDYEEVFAENKHIEFKVGLKSGFRLVVDEGRLLREAGNDLYDRVNIDENKMSVLIFTSGTTSNSKAVMLSQRNLTSNTYGLLEHEVLHPTDIYAAVLPLHHAFGAQAILMFVSIGMCIVFAEGLRLDKCLNEYGVTVFVGVPLILNAIYKKIQHGIDKQGKRKSFEKALKLSNGLMKVHVDVRRKLFKDIIDQLGGKLWFMINGASGVDERIEKFFNDIGILTVNGYGLTEMSPVVASESWQYLRYGSIGKAMPNVEVMLDEPDENGIGELLAKGPNTMLGYYNEPELTANVMKNGYFCTGDLARIDKDGYIFIAGRKKNVIVLPNGKNVFPEEIEMKLEQFNYVKECLVYGDDSIRAKIVYDPDIFGKDSSKEEIKDIIQYDIDKLNETLTGYKKIVSFEVSDEPMIKTTTGKVKRFKELEKIKK